MCDKMATVNAELFAIVLGGTEGLLNVKLDHGYTFQKVDIRHSEWESKYVNAQGQIINPYVFCQLPPVSSDNAFFICLTKRATLPCSIKAFSLGEFGSSNIFDETMQEWLRREEAYISYVLSTLRLFKEGSIEIANIHVKCSAKYKVNVIRHLYNRQRAGSAEVYENFYELTTDEAEELNVILANRIYRFDLIDNIRDKFEIGCTDIRNEVAFKELITVGEALFLNYNSRDGDAKKQKLSNRLAAWIGQDDKEVLSIKIDITEYYEYRSEDTHEATNSSISEDTTRKLREYIRRALKKYLEEINRLSEGIDADFASVRHSIVSEIVRNVEDYQSRGIL